MLAFTEGKLAVDFALNNLKLKKIAVLHDKGDYGKGFAEYAKNYINDSKKATVVLFEGVTPGAVDYSKELETLIIGIRDEGKISILIIEHDMRLVMSLSDCVYVMDYGEMIARGTPREIRENPIVALGISLVPEGRRIFPRLTVMENLDMGAFLRKDKADIKKDINHIFELFPILAERRQQHGGTLSGGEQPSMTRHSFNTWHGSCP